MANISVLVLAGTDVPLPILPILQYTLCENTFVTLESLARAQVIFNPFVLTVQIGRPFQLLI